MSQPERRFTPESARIVKQGVSQLRDPLVKKSEKVLIAIGIVYALWPLDILPDFIPFIGAADDFVITGGTILTAVIAIVSRAMARKVQKTVDDRQPRPPQR
ncbi:MAG: hypothetical protein JWM07_713 [Candidatus Saccharibacteria bacterium]|nr:hypothetical protein [Candidatus Saccharibacteria bacterium]